MIKISYNISFPLKQSLHTIELLRQKMLLTPLSPKTELCFRWEATVKRLYWSLTFADQSLSKAEIAELLTTQNKKHLTARERDVLNYKRTIDYIVQNWLVSSKLVTPSTIFTLHRLACPGRLHIPEKNLIDILNHIQTGSENPIIQAAIAQIQLLSMASLADFAFSTDGNRRLSQLAALLFLYKNGYDFRGMLILEEYWERHNTLFQEATAQAFKNGDITFWLKCFTQGVITQLHKVTQKFASAHTFPELSSSFWELNQRQKDILTFLEEPRRTITNRQVQRLFKISQITASRELSKLVTLGLLFTHGKGRSVYYTKV